MDLHRTLEDGKDAYQKLNEEYIYKLIVVLMNARSILKMQREICNK
jgi:hypothetical protein